MNDQTVVFSQILKDIYDRVHSEPNLTVHDIMVALSPKLTEMIQKQKSDN